MNMPLMFHGVDVGIVVTPPAKNGELDIQYYFAKEWYFLERYLLQFPEQFSLTGKVDMVNGAPVIVRADLTYIPKEQIS